jgi:nitrite reductase/ring-hydroxylating ferredoxin subunit
MSEGSDGREERPERAERVDRVVRDLLAGRRLSVGPADAQDRDVILAAARLAGAREAYPRMTPAFRRKLAERLEAGRESRVVSRRTALVAGLAAAFGALSGAGLARVSGLIGPVAPTAPLRPVPAAVPGVVDPRPGRWFDAGAMTDFLEGEPVRFQAGAVGTFLVRSGQTVVGLSSICTHLPCELDWKGSQHQLVCPCHNLSFNTEGASMVGPEAYPLPPLPRLQVRVVNGRVQVLGA